MIEKDLARILLITMKKIRIFEEEAVKLFAAHELPGWLHSYIGEEAVAAGVCLALNLVIISPAPIEAMVTVLPKECLFGK